jgi:hypothetical protein
VCGAAQMKWIVFLKNHREATGLVGPEPSDTLKEKDVMKEKPLVVPS